MFEFFKLNSNTFSRRISAMLREAKFAQVEHEAAAEHHDALARMYAERVQRLERQLAHALNPEMSAAVPSTVATEALAAERPPIRVLRQNATQAVG